MRQWWSELEEVQRIAGVELELARAWPVWLAIAAVAGGIACAVVLYRRQGRLSRGKRMGLTALRVVVVGWVALALFEPVFSVEADVRREKVVAVLVDGSDSMRLAEPRTRAADLREAAAIMGLAEADGNEPLSPEVRRQVEGISRLRLTRALLGGAGAGTGTGWLDAIAASHRVHGYTFAGSVEAMPEGIVGIREAIREESREGATSDMTAATALGEALDHVLAAHAETPIAGIVLITDGASNRGVEVREAARRAANQGVKVYPVGVGVADPPDVAIERLQADEVVFPGEGVRVRVKARTTGLAGETTMLRLRVGGQVVAEREVTLAAGVDEHVLTFEPTEAQLGPRSLEAEVEAVDGEVTLANNRWRLTLRVIDQRVRVLYVERAPRWAYRYLKRTLDGDRRLETRYLLMAAMPEVAARSASFVSELPRGDALSEQYDVVIVGDVPAGRFDAAEMSWLRSLVRDRGGAMVMLAGDRHAPMSYAGSPIESMLPVRIAGGDASTATTAATETLESIDAGVYPVVTREGRDAAPVALHVEASVNEALWRGVRPLHRLPRLNGTQTGARVWVTLSDERLRSEPYPLVAWRRFGSGRVLYVGSEELWRMRRLGGPGYHERFWREAVRSLGVHRLITGGQRIAIETGRMNYEPLERVKVYASVRDASWSPVEREGFVVEIEGGERGALTGPMDGGAAATDRQTSTRPGEASAAADPDRRVELRPVPGQPGLYAGHYVPQSPGHYTVRAAEVEARASNVASFDVQRIDLEAASPGMAVETLDQVARLTGGEMLMASEADRLPELLAEQSRPERRTYRVALWDQPATFVLLTLLLGVEWFARRRAELV